MATRFRADNIGSLLRPAELLEARAALREAQASLAKDEVPVGCVLVRAGEIIADGGRNGPVLLWNTGSSLSKHNSVGLCVLCGFVTRQPNAL